MDGELAAENSLLCPLLEKPIKTGNEKGGKTRITALGEGYVMVMMDSGAGNHVCNPAIHFTNFRTHASAGSKSGRVFQTADGTEIKNLGEKHVRLQTQEGQSSTITFQCADVDVPILSTRRLALAGHEIRYRHNGGVIIHLKTKHKTKFVVKDGVYFLKLKELEPPSNEAISTFHRPGRN